MAPHRMTPARRAALKKAQMASARKRRGRGVGKQKRGVPSARSKYRASKKSLRKNYKAKRKAWKKNPRVRSHTKAVYRGAAAGTLLAGPGLGTNIGAYAASAHNLKKHGKLPTHPRGAYRGQRKALKSKYKKSKAKRR